VIIPVGARVTGRITDMQPGNEHNRGSWEIGVKLLKVEWPGTRGRARFALRRATGMKPRNSLFITRREPVLTAGFPMTWRVE
jgi:hypothetical protein